MEGSSQGPKKLIYVGGLAEEVDTKVLNAAFIPFGDIVEVNKSSGEGGGGGGGRNLRFSDKRLCVISAAYGAGSSSKVIPFF